jgi:GTPase SAR1 family protein
MKNSNIIFFGYDPPLADKLIKVIVNYFTKQEKIVFSEKTIKLLSDEEEINNDKKEDIFVYENEGSRDLKLINITNKIPESKHKIFEHYSNNKNIFVCAFSAEHLLKEQDETSLKKIHTLLEKDSLNDFFCIIDTSKLDDDEDSEDLNSSVYYVNNKLGFLFKNKQDLFDNDKYQTRVFFVDLESAEEYCVSEELKESKFLTFLKELTSCCLKIGEEETVTEKTIQLQQPQKSEKPYEDLNTEEIIQLQQPQKSEKPYEDLNKMAYKTENFINDLEKISKARQEFAGYLSNTAEIIIEAEHSGSSESGRLSLDNTVADLKLIAKNLEEGVFRLLVLGDMKRGKSTFLNALIGERLLPTDVNPCTAVLTVLNFGQEKRVTVNFNDGKEPDRLDFESFKVRYTINPEEAKRLEEEGKQAFPGVDYAEVNYPLQLLEKGVQIIDSPGLNDTEARNNLTLGYVNNCHAILFVLSATQQFTLGEQRYLENYIQDRGLTVFFLINAWDEIQRRLIDPDDLTEKQQAEERVRQVFKTNLAKYCQVDGEDVYEQRVFEVSSLNALRQRLKSPSGSLDGTGFPEFIKALNTFLTKERAISELRQARTQIRQSYRATHEAVERRIPMLGMDINDLKQRIRNTAPDFEKLVDIRDQFKDEIVTVGENKASTLSTSIRSYISSFADTFEEDFVRYQPKLNFIDFLRKKKRQEFEASLEQSFEQYLNDKVSTWSRDAQREIDSVFAQLARSASQYGASYSKVTDHITEKLTGQKIVPNADISVEDGSPGWAKWATGLLILATGNVAGVAMAGTGVFNWKQILLNLGGVILINASISAATGALLGPLGIALSGLGLGGISAEVARRKVIKTMKDELVKVLPQISQEQSLTVYQTVKQCFNTYQEEVVKRMNDDIQSQKTESDELLKQKESHEIDRDKEIKRLRLLNSNVLQQMHSLEDSYDKLLGQA